MSVRHSGYDVMDFFGEQKVPFDTLEAPILAYLDWRHADMSDISKAAENDETLERRIYEWGTERDLSQVDAETHGALRDEMRDAIDKSEALTEQFESFLCSYSDYEVLVDVDAKKVYLIEWGGPNADEYALVDIKVAALKRKAAAQ